MNLNDLLKAFQPVQKIAVKERLVTVGDTKIGLRVLNSDQEGALTAIATSQMAEYSKRLMEGDLSDISSFLNASGSFNRELDVLQYAIYCVGGVDFSAVSEIDTGEKLPNGAAVSIPKHEAIRQILTSYPDSILKMLYSHYQVLHEQSVSAVEAAIINPASDLKVEIDLIQSRLDKMNADYKVMQEGLKTRLGVTELLERLDSEDTIILSDPRFEETSEEVLPIEVGPAEVVVGELPSLSEDSVSSFSMSEEDIDNENRRLYMARKSNRRG